MSNVTVKLKNGETREFVERGRPGGSYYVSVRYEAAFVIIKDEWGEETAFPASDVAEVKHHADTRGRW